MKLLIEKAAKTPEPSSNRSPGGEAPPGGPGLFGRSIKRLASIFKT
jgi:hypothetical protein